MNNLEEFNFDAFLGDDPNGFDLSAFSIKHTMAQLRADYAKVREHLVEDRVEEAHALIKTFFEARRLFYNETHHRVNAFISPLLKSFCLAWKASMKSEKTSFDAQKVNFMNDFLEFCVAAQKYDELEILLQECRCPIIETRAHSPDDVFLDFNYDEDGAQGHVAHIYSPKETFYWEDSRMYCRTWNAVTMKRVHPNDPMAELPIAVAVDSDQVKCPDTDDVLDLQDSEIIAVLDRHRQANDWRIFAAWGCQERVVQSILETPTAHKIWIFPEDVVAVACKGQTFNPWFGKIQLPEDMYRFHHIPGAGSEWMTIRHPARYFAPKMNGPPNEPHQTSDGKLIYPKVSSFDVEHQSTKARVRKETYSIQTTGRHSIEVTVPFIPWDCFETTAYYLKGLSYRDYMAVIKDGLSGNYDYFKLRARLCRETNHVDPPEWKIPVGIELAKSQAGFFNHTPSGKTIVVRNESFGGKNLVSSRWCDWKYFSQGQAESRLALPCGNFSCVGSVTGLWEFEDAVDVQWHTEFLVVDATFTDDSGNACNFMLSESTLKSQNAKILTSPELRSFSARLSPFLFRAKEQSIVFGSKWKRFEQIDAAATIDDETIQWEEMNRREKWDRSYEKRLRLCRMQTDATAALGSLQIEYDQEQASRQDWNSRHQQPVNSSSSNVDVSTAASDTGPSVSVSVQGSTTEAGKTGDLLSKGTFRKLLGRRK